VAAASALAVAVLATVVKAASATLVSHTCEGVVVRCFLHDEVVEALTDEVDAAGPSLGPIIFVENFLIDRLVD
jgi:hypothetical protein